MSSILRAFGHGFVTGASATGWVAGAALGVSAVAYLWQGFTEGFSQRPTNGARFPS